MTHLDHLWPLLREQAVSLGVRAATLRPLLDQVVLSQPDFSACLCEVVSRIVHGPAHTDEVALILRTASQRTANIAEGAAADLVHRASIDSSPGSALASLLGSAAYQAVQAHRFEHALHEAGDTALAALLQGWSARALGIDIHPAASIAPGVFVDHGIGLVIGSTAVVEAGVTLFHGVTLGSTLVHGGARHPKVRANATVAAGASVLGNIEVGAGAMVAAGSVVVRMVPAGKLVAGVPARIIGEAPDWLAKHRPLREVMP